ncbi:MAG: tRNA (adenosine(37)-N6)-threonylcarbamoyltransferase complex dimerization subunit type 1 TsaB [Candidatus Falkowbacteria bacterium]
MILFINTASYDEVIISLLSGEGKKIKNKKFKAPRKQAEKLLPAIAKLLLDANKSLADLTKIQVVVSGGSFTSLRIGVVTANALAYALNIPIEAVKDTLEIIKNIQDKKFATYNIVTPQYDREPNIGLKKKK